MPISQYSLLSEHNEGNVRLFFFATMFCFLSLVISIVAGTENVNYRLVGVLCGIGIVFLILGFVWPPLRRYLVSRQHGIRLAESTAQLATSSWAWFILVMFVAGYAAFFAVNNSNHGFVLTGDAENYEGSPLGVWWRTARMVIVTPPLVYGFAIDAKNVGTDELTLKEAYLISGIDSTKVNMLVSTPPMQGIIVPETAPIPPNTRFTFTASFDNITEQEFFRKWSNFSMIVQYNNTSKPLRHEFDRQWVIDQVNQNHPESQPHVSKRQS